MRSSENMRVCVMGLGKIGLPVATYISKFYPVIGYDINEKAIKRALAQNIEALIDIPFADVYVIAVNTFYNNNAPDMSAVDSCCFKIGEINRDALVCIESTLSVGSAQKMALEHNLKYVVVCPHRWWEEDQVNYGVKQLRVIGALDKESLDKAISFYEILQIPLFQLSSLELAEATKIAENAHRYVQIAFAEELKLIALKNNLPYDEWRSAINTKWNVDIPEARNGIGKECLPKDTAFLSILDPDAALLRGAMQANENYVENIKNSNICMIISPSEEPLSINNNTRTGLLPNR